MSVIYFQRGFIDATDEQDVFQCVGIEAETGKIFDDSELIYFDDVPDLSAAENVEMLEELMEDAGWEKVE